MKIPITFDDEIIDSYAQRGRSLSYKICWFNDGHYFPGEDWFDFGSVILGWWLVASGNLLLGSYDEEFLFMDGPYSLLVEKLRNFDELKVYSDTGDFKWIVSRNEFVNALLNASDIVINKFKNLNIDPDLNSLIKGKQKLELILNEIE